MAANANVFDKWIRASFYALICFLPVSIAFVSVFSAFAIALFLLKRILRAVEKGLTGWVAIVAILSPPPCFLNRPLGLFVAAVLLSVVFSQFHMLSLWAFCGKLLRGVLLYGSFLEAFTGAGHIRNFVFAWITSAFITGVSGWSQYFGGIDFLRGTAMQQGRVSSSLRHANDFGAYLVSVCPLLVVLLLYGKSWTQQTAAWQEGKVGSAAFLRVFFLIVCCVLLVCLGLTFSRSAWIAFFIGLVAVGLSRMKKLFIIFLMIAGFAMIFSPIMLKTRGVSLTTDNARDRGLALSRVARQEGVFSKEYARTAFNYTINRIGMGRSQYWREALGLIYDFPLFGAGLNTYSKMGNKYRINGTFEFQADEFDHALEKVQPLLLKLGQPIGQFGDIKEAIQWLNESTDPYRYYINYLQENDVHEDLRKWMPEGFKTFNGRQLKALAHVNDGQRFKRVILNKLYPEETPKSWVSWGGYPHNSYLQMTAEIGLVGMAAFLWMLWVFFRALFQKANQMPEGYLRCVLIGTLGGCLAHLIQSFFDTTFYSVQLSVLLWLMLALSLAVARVGDQGVQSGT